MTSYLASASHIAMFDRPYGPRLHRDEEASSAPVVREAPAGTSESMSATQAARTLAALRNPPKKPAAEAQAATEPTAESADDPATAESELPDEGNAAQAEEPAPGESAETEPEAETLPPLGRPRSWNADDVAEWNALPRARQEKILANERARDADHERRTSEAAEKLKAVTAREQQAEQVRSQYEIKLKGVVDVLEKEQLREFPDIRSQADLDKLIADANQHAAEANQLLATDPLAAMQAQGKFSQIQARLQAWDVHQRKLVAAHDELQAAEGRKAKERDDAWQTHRREQDALAAEKIPELKDEKKGPELIKRAVAKLIELGYTQDDLNKLASGEEKISVYDYRLQQLLDSALKYDDITKAKKAAAKAPVPPVQRPGTPAPRGSADSENLKALTAKLNKSGSLKDAIALRVATQKAADRRAP